MTRTQILIIVILAAVMAAAALAMGNWSAQINPDGISENAVSTAESSQDNSPRDAFSFGASLGLLGTALFYCCIAMGLLIHTRTKGKAASAFIYWVAGLAIAGFALSYLVDDYFY